MKLEKVILTLIISLAWGFGLHAQDNIRTYSFKKGEVVDFLLLNQNEGADETLKRYFEKAIPIATQNGYSPNKGFAVKEAQIQGNYKPDAFLIASWPNLKTREECLLELETTLPDFHKMRRTIWSNFNVAFYPLSADLSFEVDMDKYNVATAYWLSKGELSSNFILNWKKLVKKTNGKKVIQFTQPQSTFGYEYKPDYLIITSWDSQQDFENFKSKNLEMDHLGVEHVNQFRIQ